MSTKLFTITFQSVPVVRKPWRIAEVVNTSEGPRTRWTGWCYESEAEAQSKLDKLEGGAKPTTEVDIVGTQLIATIEDGVLTGLCPAKPEPTVGSAGAPVPQLTELLAKARARVDAMTPLEYAIMQLEQREGYVSAEWRMNDDASPNGRIEAQAEAMLRKIAPEYLVLDEMRRAHAENTRMKKVLAQVKNLVQSINCGCACCNALRKVEDLLG